MKQILIKKTKTISQVAGTKIHLNVTEDIFPSMVLLPRKATVIEIPLEVKVMMGGDDWDFTFKLNKMLAMEGVTSWAEKVGDKVQVVLINNSDFELQLYDGAPILEAIMVPLVSFRQVENSFREDGVIVVESKQEERRGEAQVKKALKEKKKKK